MNEERFLTEYENLLDKGYCNCNEMNCIDNNSPRRILNIAKRLRQENQQLKEQLKQKEDIINKAREYIKDNANIYTNIMGKEVGFFKRHNDGWTPIELLEILDDKGE